MEEKKNKRSWQDKIVCGFNGVRYFFGEKMILRITRVLHEREYKINDSNPLVSVYIPTYNRAQLLKERSVPSVLGQTYKNFELIILGDHCTDGTEEFVAGIKDPRIKFYNLPKRGYRYPPTAENHWLAGPVVAANKALEMVSGKWIARLDDDDIWTPDHLEILVKFAVEGNYEFVSSSYTREYRGKKEVVGGARADDPYYNPGKKGEGIGPKVGGTCTWLYRSYLKFFRYNINCWRKSWNRVNDVDLTQRIFHAGVRMGHIDKSLAWYLPRPGEEAIGLEAYQKAEEKKEEYYKFY